MKRERERERLLSTTLFTSDAIVQALTQKLENKVDPGDFLHNMNPCMRLAQSICHAANIGRKRKRETGELLCSI